MENAYLSGMAILHSEERVKQRLIAMASHDLRSPLMSILINLEVLRTGQYGISEAGVNDAILVIKKNIQRTMELIQELLIVERFDAAKINQKSTRVSTWASFCSEDAGSLFYLADSAISEQKQIDQINQKLVSMISHELHRLLMAVSNSISLILTGGLGQLSPPAVPIFQAIDQNLFRLTNLVNELLDYENLQCGQLKFDTRSMQIGPMLARAAQELLALAQASNITFEVEESSLLIYGNEEKLTQVVINLLANAIRYCKPYGTVSITTRQTGKSAEVIVSDEGPGIAPDFLERIFTPFEQAPSSIQTGEGGIGLGLAICKSIVNDMHGGTIKAANREGSGASFSFTVPMESSCAINLAQVPLPTSACAQ